MKDLLPKDAKLIPKKASKVFSGEIHDTYQWPQKMYDGTTATFEMLKRTNTVLVLAVTDEQKVLILRQSQPDRAEHWTLPAGRIELDEPALVAAKRETKEETGYEFADWKLVDGVCDAGEVKRALGWAAKVSDSGVQSLPFQSIR